MVTDKVIEEVIVTNDPCDIKLQYIERFDGMNNVYVVRFKVGEKDDPKETISSNREYMDEVFTNAKLVIQ